MRFADAAQLTTLLGGIKPWARATLRPFLDCVRRVDDLLPLFIHEASLRHARSGRMAFPVYPAMLALASRASSQTLDHYAQAYRANADFTRLCTLFKDPSGAHMDLLLEGLHRLRATRRHHMKCSMSRCCTHHPKATSGDAENSVRLRCDEHCAISPQVLDRAASDDALRIREQRDERRTISFQASCLIVRIRSSRRCASSMAWPSAVLSKMHHVSRPSLACARSVRASSAIRSSA